MNPESDCHTAGDGIRYCFEISPLLSNIELDYTAASFCTNPIGRNDVYGYSHLFYKRSIEVLYKLYALSATPHFS